MAVPMTPDELLTTLRKWNVPFKQVDGWQTRNRDAATGRAFGPVHGFVVHHTGSDGADSINRDLIVRGRSDLPGPLAQFGCDDDGFIWLIGWGRANHAGGGDKRVLDAVIAESYGDYPPASRHHTGSTGAYDGNDVFYGVETFYSGANPPTHDAYASLVLLSAAICDHHGWSAKSVIGHKEWSNWKIDPGGVDMKEFREDVQDLLDSGSAYAETRVNMRRAKRQVKNARRITQLAIENLNVAIEAGHNVRGIRKRLREIRNAMDSEIDILERRY